MLNTLPPSPVPSSPGIRRRGGQPSNRNAFKHGFFAEKNPTHLTQLVNAIPLSKPGLERIPEVLTQAIPAIRQQIARLFESSPEGADLRSVLAWHRPILRLLGLFIRANRALARIQQPQFQMKFVAAHALALIRYDFRENGITRDAYSFREKNNLSDLKRSRENFFASPTDSPPCFLTCHQSELLEPLIPIPDRADPRGRPLAHPRPLLDAIFWKLAHHARWQDLPTGSPPKLTCRRYYRLLFLSGRLLTIYSALYKDFLRYAKTDLPGLVNQNYFSISGNTLVVCSGFEETWQVRTALLFMQQAWQVSCRIMREKEQVQRRSLLNFR
jgi:hypothetical protein